MVRLEDDEGADRLTGLGIGGSDDGGLGDAGVADEGRFDLSGGDAVPGDVHDIVDAAQQPDRALVIPLGTVAREVVLRPARPVGIDVPLVVAPDPAQHRRPRLGEDEVAAAAIADRGAVVVDDSRADTRQRSHR